MSLCQALPAHDIEPALILALGQVAAEKAWLLRKPVRDHAVAGDKAGPGPWLEAEADDFQGLGHQILHGSRFLFVLSHGRPMKDCQEDCYCGQAVLSPVACEALLFWLRRPRIQRPA
ncbi:hypothetical protein AJ88_43935 [Mesorhizobium amorphae CCBAU 01583]|nr:hypothetical protein AJ88_43935 [Mesorhizobium amorphae CCBAU 01583]